VRVTFAFHPDVLGGHHYGLDEADGVVRAGRPGLEPVRHIKHLVGVPKVAADIEDSRGRQVAILPWRLERDGTLSIMLITSRTNSKWMLPKGWPIAGKTDAQAAAQEALEEAGIEGEVQEAPLGSYYYVKMFDDGSTKPAQAIIFSMRVTSQRRKWPEMLERRRKWYRAQKAAKMAFEPDLARFLGHVAAGRVVLSAATR